MNQRDRERKREGGKHDDEVHGDKIPKLKRKEKKNKEKDVERKK